MVSIRSQTLVLTAMLVTVLSWALSGCKFGNRVEEGGPPDGWSGKYEVDLRSHSRCVLLSGNQGAICEPEEAAQVPATIRSVFTNPVLFQLARAGEGGGYFIASNDQTRGFPTRIDLNNSEIQHSSVLSEPSHLWTAGDCYGADYMFQTGHVRKTRKTGILGRVEVDLTLQTSFTGTECQAVLAIMSSCILDLTRCEPSDQTNTQTVLQTYAKSVFSPYVDKGLITNADIQDVEAFGTVISYR